MSKKLIFVSNYQKPLADAFVKYGRYSGYRKYVRASKSKFYDREELAGTLTIVLCSVNVALLIVGVMCL